MARWSTQRIRDPIHGLVTFGGTDSDRNETDRIAWSLINTCEFQRLRRIRQLGFSDLVFPGATHSRFAHSIGVYHMARQLVDVIIRQPNVQRNPDRERVVLLAALLHDIGHGPFSHAFESVARAVGLSRRHEEWSAEIVEGETQVNQVLRDADEQLPKQIGLLLTDEAPEDVYSAIVSSQFDADRLDYVQRDRMMTGVGFGHIDRDWLLDCLRVGVVTIGRDVPEKAHCFYISSKGVQVAEEYLEARYRLFRMVYMHKTTRSAEKMLETLLKIVVAKAKNNSMPSQGPVLRYMTSENPTLESYLDLDDAAVWTALAVYASDSDQTVSELAQRLRNRALYKCIDIGAIDKAGGNLLGRLRGELSTLDLSWKHTIIFDDTTVAPYKWYNFNDASALKKVLVKSNDEMNEPEDIVGVSGIVKTFRNGDRIQRAYVPERCQAEKLKQILTEVNR